MKNELSEKEKYFLKKTFKTKDSFRLISAIENETLNFAEIEEACAILSAEFHMNGIDENFEANSYGKEIESLIDVINRPRLK